MAYGNQFLKLTWGFLVNGTDEVAATSLDYTTAPGWTGAVAALGEIQETNLEDLVGQYVTFMANSTAIQWATYSHLHSFKVAAIGTDGHYLTDPKVWEAADAGNGGDSGQVVPQASVVLSLRSGFTLGGGNYGRMFLPHTMLPLESNSPRSSMANAEEAAEDAVSFVNGVTAEVNSATTATLFPAIMSQATGLSFKGVTEISVGRVTDTQRRRRNRLDEGYATLPLA